MLYISYYIYSMYVYIHTYVHTFTLAHLIFEASSGSWLASSHRINVSKIDL